jgi:uncharacterized protein (DUF2267 family)
LSIHTLSRDSNATAGQVLDDLIEIRLFREENEAWIEKAVITRIWIGTTNSCADKILDQLQEFLDRVSQHLQVALSAPATHAAQVVSEIRAIS